jgi:hypothetical protein
LDLTDWLTQHGLQEYDGTLRDEGFEDLASLVDLTEADLRELGLKMAHAKRLLKALREDSRQTDAAADSAPAPAAGSDTLEAFRKNLALAERLAALDPDNAGWQRDLAVSLYKTGEMQDQLGHHSVAADFWLREPRVRDGLAALEVFAE